jgi:hypothetical protein
MTQNDFFMYHSDKTTRIIYADYLESRGDLFLASVLREEENVPITCEFRGAEFGGGSGSGLGDGEGYGEGYGSIGKWVYGHGDGSGYGNEGNASAFGFGYGMGWGYGNGDGWSINL